MCVTVAQLRRARHDGEAVVENLWQQGDEDTDAGARRCRED